MTDKKISDDKNSAKTNEEILAMEKKNNHMLILERSLYILKKKFEIHKNELEIIYKKYRHKNYKKLKCINVDFLLDLYDEMMKTLKFKMIPYTNSKEVLSADLIIELNKEKRRKVLRSLEQFTLKNVSKYNKIYFDEKIRKKKLKEEQERDKKEEEEKKRKEEEILNSQAKIIKIDKRGKIICTFEEMLKNNIDLGAGVNLFSSGDEDDIIILDNNKLLYTDVLRLVIADYLQYSEPGGTFDVAIIAMGEDLDNKEDSKLNEEVKKLYDSEIVKVNTNIVKVDQVEEKKEKLKTLLLELMNVENQLSIYQNLLMKKSFEGNTNIKHIVNFINKLKEQKLILEKKIEQIKLELNGRISIINNNINMNNSNSSYNIKNSYEKNYMAESYQSNNEIKVINKTFISSQTKTNIKKQKYKLSSSSSSKNTKQVIKRNITEGNLIDVSVNDESNNSKYFKNISNPNKYLFNYNNENFYYNYGIKDPSTKEEFRKNNLLEIFYFYSKQHSFIGLTPSFEEILKSEEHLYLEEFSKFVVEFKIMVKPKKITEIFKKNTPNGKEMNFESFVNILKILSKYSNDEKMQYTKERINLSKLKLKEISEKEKQKLEQKNNNENNKNNLNNNSNNYVSTNLRYYQKSKNKSNNNQNNKTKLIKPNKKIVLISEQKEELQEKIALLQKDYDILAKKTEAQLIEEFYQYLEIDDPNLYRKKMIGYIYPFRNREKASRFPLKSVMHPVKRDPKVEKELHNLLVKRHEDMKKEKEIKQQKEKNILFEKRKKKFEEENIKLFEKMSKTNNYKQLKMESENYQKSKMNKLTWKMIQDCDYDSFILNIDKNNNKRNLKAIFNTESNGNEEDYLKSFKNKKELNINLVTEGNNKIINNNININTNNINNNHNYNNINKLNKNISETEPNGIKIKNKFNNH